MTDPDPAVSDSMFMFQPFVGDESTTPATMTRRDGSVGALTQTGVILLDFESFSPSFWFPLWTFGDLMGVFRPQTSTENSYVFDSMPLSEYDAPYGQLLFPLDFNPDSSPVEFSAGPGGPLENFEIGFAEGIVPRFTASAPFPKTGDSPALIITGFLEDDTSPAVAVAFGARTDSGIVAEIPVMQFAGATAEISPSTSTIVLGDFDGDGNTDMILMVDSSDANEDRQLVMSKGVGDGTFQAPIFRPLSANHIALDLAAVDFEGDGAMELVISYLTTDETLDPPGPGAIQAVTDPLGTFDVRSIALPSAEQRPTWVEAMDCDLDQARDDLVIVTNRIVEGFDFGIRASDVLCYLNGDSAQSIVLYPEAAFNLPEELADRPYLSFVANSAVGTLGCGDAWAGTAAFLVVPEEETLDSVKFGEGGENFVVSVSSVFAQHTDCSGGNGGGGGGGGGALIQGAGCSLAPAPPQGLAWWILASLLGGLAWLRRK